jgi:hypothetical protein
MLRYSETESSSSGKSSYRLVTLEPFAMFFNPQPADKNAYTYENPGAPENYCWLLAGEIRAHAKRLGVPVDPLEKPEQDREAGFCDLAKSFLDSLGRALPDSHAGLVAPFVSTTFDQKHLCDLLFASPRAQARVAALVEYTPSKWLLQQEITAMGLWPKQASRRGPRVTKEPFLPQALQPAITSRASTTPPVEGLGSAGRSAHEQEHLSPASTEDDCDESNPTSPDPLDVYQVAARLRLSGMCFSGGGIRSATFNLGILQALAARGKLGCFDYFSTVSGGGYIHQFLASWIDLQGLAKVEEQLTPIPGPPTRSVWPDPLRWLRRYSNYLTPQKGLFSADTWVAGAIWLRNTILNQIVLVSSLLLLLLVPHFHLTHSGKVASFILTTRGAEIVAVLVLVLLGFAAGRIGTGVISVPDPAGTTGSCIPSRRESMRQIDVLMYILAPIILASLLVSPYIFRSAFWNPIPRDSNANIRTGANPLFSSARSLCATAKQNLIKGGAVPPACAMVTMSDDLGPDSTQRIIAATRLLASAQKLKSASGKIVCTPPNCSMSVTWPIAENPPSSLDNLHEWQSTFSFPWWRPNTNGASFVFGAFLLGICLLVSSSWVTMTQQQRDLPTTVCLFVLIVVTAGAFGYLFIHLLRIGTFYEAFFLPQGLVTSCSIVLLPLGVLNTVLVCVNIGVGLVGHLMEDASREWLARLRAWSFMVSFAWLCLTGASLFGHWIVAAIMGIAYVKHVAIFGWIGTTIASLLAGKSPSTQGPEKGDKTASSPFSVLNILTAIGPPVFMIGLILLLASLVEVALNSLETEGWKVNHPYAAYTIVFALLSVIALFFGWRVDINDFSLHAFYRDRLARCYAGASNPDRKSDHFTGFSPSDGRLRLVDLLPASFTSTDMIDLWKPPVPESEDDRIWRKLQEARRVASKAEAAVAQTTSQSVAGSEPHEETKKGEAGSQNAWEKLSSAINEVEAAARQRLACFRKSTYYNRWYGGPFPIFCTSLNLSFGEDLAYQERKAAAFAFTPLYSGYDVGWTEGRSHRVQFNGFTPTCDFAYPHGGPHMTTAVAASGAAISPNWGYHTSPAMAFLLTMFNVRLGWWIRNPRHREFAYSQFLRDHRGIARYIDENPASPRFPICYLVAELLGLVNDESSYVYLTDGGHFENMGLYELVRRRCMKILISDAEEDHEFVFEGIGMAIRKCRIDFGAEINLDLDALKRNSENDSPTHFVIGSIQYPEVDELGSILYIKSTLSKGLPADLINYRKQDQDFPHDTTLNQWFTESKFESYRRLGQFSIQPNADTTIAGASKTAPTDIENWLDSLDSRG